MSEVLPGMPEPPYEVSVGLSGSDTWRGLDKDRFGRLKNGSVVRLDVYARITQHGTKETSDDPEAPFVKLAAFEVDVHKQDKHFGEKMRYLRSQPDKGEDA